MIEEITGKISTSYVESILACPKTNVPPEIVPSSKNNSMILVPPIKYENALSIIASTLLDPTIYLLINKLMSTLSMNLILRDLRVTHFP